MLAPAQLRAGTAPTTGGVGTRRRWLAFLGPACLVSVGYMDPGNWATDLEGGTHYGFQLLWVLVASSAIALLLQSLSARLGLVTGKDLATACRLNYTPATAVALWVLAEAGIVACDLAELVGSALALQMLFGLPLVLGAALTCLDVLLLMGLQRWGMGRLQSVVLALLLTIAGCLGIELIWARPAWGEVAGGLVPRLPGDSLYIAIAILGATVMPHNLYLQSGLMPARSTQPRELRRELRTSFWSTALALNLALLVNGAILVLAATVFQARGLVVTDLRDAASMLAPLLGASAASVLFAVGLLCAGQSATVTGTMAGQMVMEGFIQLRARPWVRRVVTRGLAVVPAMVVLGAVGESGAMSLLVGSQVVLSLQLPFAIVPLIRLTAAPELMGAFAARPWVRQVAIVSATLIVVANGALVVRTVQQLLSTSLVLGTSLALAGVGGALLLVWVSFVPLRGQRELHAFPLASSRIS